MPPALDRTLALASSTARDIVRRPGGVVAILITGSLLVLLPRIARRALDDGAALGVELLLSTLALHAALLAGLIAVQAGATGSALGPVPEFLTTPLRWGEYVAGRALGVIAGTATHLGVLASVAALATVLAGDIPNVGATPLIAGGVSIVLQTLVFVAAGLFAGAVCGSDLGSIALIGLIVASRLAIPALTGTAGAWAWLLPDAARVDVAREVALGRPLGAAAWSLLWAATLLQSGGLLLAAYWRLSSRSLLTSAASA